MKIKFANIFKKKEKKHKKESSGVVKEFIAKLSRGLMLPIAMLPIAGLFLGIGSAISGTAGDSVIQSIIGKVISTGGNIVFECLPVLFCVAIAITFTGDAGVAGLSSFVGWIVFCALQSAMLITVGHTQGGQTVVDYYKILFWTGTPDQYNAIFTTNVGITSLSTGVFGGIIVGWCTAFLYNKFKNIELPTVLGFFSGVRFIPIVTFVASLGLGLIFSIVWPWIGLMFYYMGSGLSSVPGGLNSLVFGFFNRALVPFGLHHVIDTTLWFSSVGGTFDATQEAIVKINNTFYYVLDPNDGTIATWKTIFALEPNQNDIITGDIDIYIFLSSHLTNTLYTLESITDVSNVIQHTLSIDAVFRGTEEVNGLITCNPGQYTSGAYILTIFALPSAALAMLMAAPKGDGRKVASSIVVSAAFVCFLTGITEPIEFTFLFLAPWLFWGFHAFMAAIAYLIPTCMSLYMPTGWGPHVAFSFSSGFLDYTIYGIVSDAKGVGSNCWILLPFSAIYGVIYYFVFYWAIKRFDLKTPGRGGQTKLFTKKDYLKSKESKSSSANNEIHELAVQVIAAYGGKENIKNVDACITKLRVQVVDKNKADKEKLLSLGARGVMYPSKQSVYAVFGTQADRIKNEMKAILSR